MPESKKQIWDTLCKVDVAQYIKFVPAKNVRGPVNLPYLPWHAMHFLMMQSYPEYVWSFSEDHQLREAHYYEGGSAEVRCTMSIGEHTIITSLPVRIEEGFDAEAEPDSTLVNTAKQRARVKAAAEFGLGFLLWHSPEIYLPPDVNHSDSKKEVSAGAPVPKPNYISEQEYFDKHVAAHDNRAAAAAGMKKLKGALKNRKKSIMPVQSLWEEMCTERGWKI